MSLRNSPILTLERPASAWRLTIKLIALLLAALWPWWVAVFSMLAAAMLSVVSVACWSWAAGLFSSFRASSVVRATWHAAGHWSLYREDGEELPATLCETSWVTRHLMVLRWRCGQMRYGFTIMQPELGAAEWRRWQVRLRLEGGTPPAAETGLPYPQ